jgi:hypothetical protein
MRRREIFEHYQVLCELVSTKFRTSIAPATLRSMAYEQLIKAPKSAWAYNMMGVPAFRPFSSNPTSIRRSSATNAKVSETAFFVEHERLLPFVRIQQADEKTPPPTSEPSHGLRITLLIENTCNSVVKCPPSGTNTPTELRTLY